MDMEEVQTHFSRAVITRTSEHFFFSSVRVRQEENRDFTILKFRINTSGAHVFSASQIDMAMLPRGESPGGALAYASVRMFVVEKVDDGNEVNPRNLNYQNGCSFKA